MAAATDTGDLRIDSAKRVLTEVISQIPNVDGVNVGLRIYGHRGDNSEAGRPESCLSSELVVPMDGVNAESLTQQVNLLQPVGWTPLGYSLQEAAKDFEEPADDDVVNAIVLVTDGLETCDADPVAIAGELQDSKAGIVTHVIGFGTTPEEQAILSGIAEAGGGQLLGSSNAGQLMSALFEVLEELEVVEETGTGETRDSPLGIGRVGEVGDYEVLVLSATPNANDFLAAANSNNEPPSEGNQYFVARVAVTYTGSTSGNPATELNFQAVGKGGSSYDAQGDSCGNYRYEDDLLGVNELFEGGSVEINVCWEIDSEDADSLVMYVEPFFGGEDGPVWFSVGNPIEKIVDPDETKAAEEKPTPTSESTRSASSTRAENDSSREDPVPVGQAGAVGDYEVLVLSATPNANDFLAAANSNNEPPSEGNQYFVARVAVTYTGSTSGNPATELNFQAVGKGGSSYDAQGDSCGNYRYEDDLLGVNELFEGGSVEINVCWEIDSEDADSLVMYVEPFFGGEDGPVWFSLEP